jgi:hypothetical protein
MGNRESRFHRQRCQFHALYAEIRLILVNTLLTRKFGSLDPILWPDPRLRDIRLKSRKKWYIVVVIIYARQGERTGTGKQSIKGI